MLAPAVTGSGVSSLVTPRSADVFTVVVATAVLLPGTTSGVVLLRKVAVLVIVVPLGVLELTWTTMVKTAAWLGSRVASVAMMKPVPPGAGCWVMVNAGPEFCVTDTNVVLAGVASVSCTFSAVLGPLLRRLTV